MTLATLLAHVTNAIEYAEECDADPEEIPVTLQIDGPGALTVWSGEDVTLHYDNDGQASGCVMVAWRDKVDSD